MSRGESTKARGGSSAIGLWSALAVITLLVGLCLASTLRDCDPFGSAVPPIAPAPVLDVQRAFGLVFDRDLYGADTSDGTLMRRMYTVAGRRDAQEMPFEISTTELDGACGVVVFVPAPTSRIVEVVAGETRVQPMLGSSHASLAVCGVRTLGVALGTGRAEARIWVMPGLTPADVRRSELTDGAALALAEAEMLLHGDGWVASGQVLRVEVAPGTVRWEPPRPSAGCLPWVVAAFGFESTRATHGHHPVDDGSRPGRQLLGALSCHDGGEVHLADPARDGGTLYALPFERGGGPRVPGAAGARLTTIGDVRVVSSETIELPAGR